MELIDIVLDPTWARLVGHYDLTYDAPKNYIKLLSMRHLDCPAQLIHFAAGYMHLAGHYNVPAALKLIATERQRQITKFGDQSHRDDGQWFDILMEEVGEVARERCEMVFLRENCTKAINALDGHDAAYHDKYRKLLDIRDADISVREARWKKESIEVAAVAFAWAAAIYKRTPKKSGDNE